MKFLNKAQKQFIKKKYYKITGNLKKKKLKCEDFSIISNNCFGGIFYRNNNLKYRTPTCGLAIMADEYIKFIYNLEYYLSIDNIEEVQIENSKYRNYLKKTKYGGIIGKIDDLEIMFLHYDSINEAKDKWNRRKKRINKDKIIFKFNDQNLCDYSHLKKFNEFSAKNKICFTSKRYDELNTIQLKQFEKYEYVLSDVRQNDYKKYFNMYKYINSKFAEEC